MIEVPYILKLFDTDLSSIEGNIPQTISLYLGKITIGRGASSDVVLSAERNKKFIISRSHASILVTKNGDSFTITVEDLGSLNGVFVNSIRINKQILKPGDILQFGGMSDLKIGQKLLTSDVAVKYRLEQIDNVNKRKSIDKNLSKENLMGNSFQLPIPATSNLAQKRKQGSLPSFSVSEIGFDDMTLNSHNLSSDLFQTLRCEMSTIRESISSVLKGLNTLTKDVEEIKKHKKNENVATSEQKEQKIDSQKKEVRNDSSISVSSLTSTLTCTICSNEKAPSTLLLDSIVLPCSHSFCLSCSITNMLKGKSTCPICNDPPTKIEDIKSKLIRSDMLDALVWVALQASSEQERSNFSKKEIVAQEIISKFEDQIKSLNPKDSKSSISNGYEFAEGKQEEYVQENVEKKPVCEYCGEETHGEGEPCPHNFNEDDQTHDYEEDL